MNYKTWRFFWGPGWRIDFINGPWD